MFLGILGYIHELEQLCEIARPDIGVITNVGTAHLENVGSQENIAKAKCEIIDSLSKDGVFIYNGDDEYLVKEGKIIYQIIKFRQGKKKYTSKEYFFGPVLLTKKDKLFREYYDKELRAREILMSLLPKSYRLKRFKIKKEIKLIRENI